MAIGKKSKEFDYYHALVEMCACSKRAAELLDDLVNDYKNVPAKVEGIHKVEHECDMLLHQYASTVNASFITPIDREDLITLSNDLDTVTDVIEDAAGAFYMYNVNTIEDSVKTMSALTVQSVTALYNAVEAFESFKDPKKLEDCVIEVNRLEEEGDRLFKESMRTLYGSGATPIHIMKWERIYNAFEALLDQCEDVADELALAAIKNR